MKRRMMILAGVFAMTAFAAMPLQAAEAEPAGEESGVLDVILGEGGIVDQLFGEGGLLEGNLPEGTDVDGMIDTLKDQLGEADSEIAEVAGSLLEKAKEKYGSFDLDYLKEILTPVLEHLLGDGADLGDPEGMGDFGKAMAQSVEARELAKNYILDKNADVLESGDVQIVDVGNIYEEMGFSKEFPYLTYVIQYNFTEDEEHQLHYISGSEDLLLLTIHDEDDAGLTASDEQVVEEDYETFLQDFCKNVKSTPEECLEDIEISKACAPYTLADYLEEHPEYTGLEYNGEMHTAEELNDIASEQLLALVPSETETEETESEDSEAKTEETESETEAQ